MKWIIQTYFESPKKKKIILLQRVAGVHLGVVVRSPANPLKRASVLQKLFLVFKLNEPVCRREHQGLSLNC